MGSFKFTSKPEFTDEEQQRILLLALLANPSSILHFGCYVGIGDGTAYSKEIGELKKHYGNLEKALANADADDFPKKKARLRALCTKIAGLRDFLVSHKEVEITDELLDEIFPSTNPDLTHLRSAIEQRGVSAEEVHQLRPRQQRHGRSHVPAVQSLAVALRPTRPLRWQLRPD